MSVSRPCKRNLRLEKWKGILRAHLPELRERYGLERTWLFGAYVRGEVKRRSDLDILVEFTPEAPMTLFKFAEREPYLSELLGVKVDLVEKKGLKPALREQVLKEAVPL